LTLFDWNFMQLKPLILALGIAFSPCSQAANLGDIYRDALANDTQYAAARAAYQAGLEALPQARSALLPNVNADGNARYNDVRTSLPNGDTSSGNSALGISATQPLYNKASSVQVDQAEEQVKIVGKQLELAGQDLILRTARAYFDVLQAQDNIVLIRSQKAAITEELAAAKRNFEVGTATILDTQEAQARFDLDLAQEIAEENALNIRLRALERIIGKPPAALDTLADKTEQAALIDPIIRKLSEAHAMDEWATHAEEGNLNVAIQRYNKTIADQQIELSRAGHYPTLNAVASYRYGRNQSLGVTLADINTAIVGVEFNLPIYQGGLVNSRVRQAVANQEKAREDLNTALREATLNARQAYLNTTSADAQVQALERSVASTKLQLESTRLGVQVGVRTSLDVLNAQQQVFSAQQRLSAARYDFFLAGLSLKAAVGTLTADDLTTIDQVLRPSTAAK
jgi:outer membrane protein